MMLESRDEVKKAFKDEVQRLFPFCRLELKDSPLSADAVDVTVRFFAVDEEEMCYTNLKQCTFQEKKAVQHAADRFVLKIHKIAEEAMKKKGIG